MAKMASEKHEEAGLMEVPRLEEKLNLLATVAQIAPLIGLLGTSLGMMDTFSIAGGLYAKILNWPLGYGKP